MWVGSTFSKKRRKTIKNGRESIKIGVGLASNTSNVTCIMSPIKRSPQNGAGYLDQALQEEPLAYRYTFLQRFLRSSVGTLRRGKRNRLQHLNDDTENQSQKLVNLCSFRAKRVQFSLKMPSANQQNCASCLGREQISEKIAKVG